MEEVGGGDGAGNGAEVVEGFADVLGYEVGGDACLYAFYGPAERCGSADERFVVACVGYHQLFLRIESFRRQVQ